MNKRRQYFRNLFTSLFTLFKIWLQKSYNLWCHPGKPWICVVGLLSTSGAIISHLWNHCRLWTLPLLRRRRGHRRILFWRKSVFCNWNFGLRFWSRNIRICSVDPTSNWRIWKLARSISNLGRDLSQHGHLRSIVPWSRMDENVTVQKGKDQDAKANDVDNNEYEWTWSRSYEDNGIFFEFVKSIPIQHARSGRT